MTVDITALYCCLDDFCKASGEWDAHRLIPSERTRQRSGKLSRAEMLLVVVLFHLSAFKHLKAFYTCGIEQHRACFAELPHYDRFVSLMPRLFVPLMVLLHSLSGEQTGIYFAGSTKLAVCRNRRIHRHKVFDGHREATLRRYRVAGQAGEGASGEEVNGAWVRMTAWA